MLRLYLQAPFAACRTFTAGWYRPTAGFLTPSAVYGLLLNVAGIESRLYEHEANHDGRVATSLLRGDLPSCRMALGIPGVGHANRLELPRVQSVFQQLHNYPVGAQAGLPPEMSMGNKNNITPVRRELLVNVRAAIAIEGELLEDRVRRGLQGEFNSGRYGLPFIGDNNLLVDKLALAEAEKPVWWYRRVSESDRGPREGVTRVTLQIDRADMSRTRSALMAPAEVATLQPPADAWNELGLSENSALPKIVPPG